MEYAYPIMSAAFGALMLIYAAVLGKTRDPGMVPKMHAADTDDPKHYASLVSRILAWISAGPLASAALYMILPEGAMRLPVSLFILFGGRSLTIWRGLHIMSGEY